MESQTILITCPDAKGLIAKISFTISSFGLNIQVMREFVDDVTEIFFCRIECIGEFKAESLKKELTSILPDGSNVIVGPKKKKDIVILATREHHCLADLLTRNNFNELNADIKAVIANHKDLGEYVGKFNIPFHHVSHENTSKESFEKNILDIADTYNPDYIILAKFMRILSKDFVTQYQNKIINIHHSFLPAFIGANPYKKAFERGVKLIGATAHFVNDNLDEGPIITQKVIDVDHTYSVKNLVQAGHEVERNVLADALRMVFEDRVFVCGNKTIILS